MPPGGCQPSRSDPSGHESAAPGIAWPRPRVAVAIGALCRWAGAHRGDWTRTCRACPHASLLRRRDHRRDPSLPSRCSSRGSPLSGRRRRARERWPPSAAQTARAVLPHAAFTKARPPAAVSTKGSGRSGSPAPARPGDVVSGGSSTPHSATVDSGATTGVAPPTDRVG